MYSSFFYKIYHWFAVLAPKIRWRRRYKITAADKDQLASILSTGYYVILTSNPSHLSSVIVSLLGWIKTGKYSKYTHALMNCDNITDPSQRDDFKFVEADVKGVIYTTFDNVFACDHVCLLTPTDISNTEWTRVIDELISNVGKPYDDLFNLTDNSRLSCVEVVLNALKAANYEEEFEDLARLIERSGNLVPQMYRDCSDFKIKYEK